MPKAAGSLAAALVLYKVFFIFIIGKKDKNVNFLNPINFPDIHTSSLCLFDFGDSIGLQLAKKRWLFAHSGPIAKGRC
jgi:hypothetical protein